MAKNYYYLVSGLPDMLLGEKQRGLNSVALRSRLEEELTPNHYTLAKSLYLPFDHLNFLNKKYASSSTHDERGLFAEEAIEKLLSKRGLESVEEEENFPTYLLDVASELAQHEDVGRWEAELKLTQRYYDYLLEFCSEFLSDYVNMERNMKNVFIALNGRKYELNVQKEYVVGSGEIVEALRKSRARDFGLAGELHRLDDMLKLFEETDLQERGFRIDQLKWDYIEELSFFHYFSIEKVLGFIMKLLLAERWMELSAEEGKQLFERLLQDLDSKYEFPEEFKLGHGKK